MRFKKGGKYLAVDYGLMYIIYYAKTQDKKSYYNYHRLDTGKIGTAHMERHKLSPLIVMKISDEMADKLITLHNKEVMI